jgi:hypothetical protein
MTTSSVVVLKNRFAVKRLVSEAEWAGCPPDLVANFVQAGYFPIADMLPL